MNATRALGWALVGLGALAQLASPRTPRPEGPARTAQDAATPTPAEVAARREAELARTIARWRESLELDLTAEVIAEARVRAAPGGEFFGDARAVALHARALWASGEREAARELIDRAEGASGGVGGAKPAELIVAERARMLLEEDELEAVIALLCEKDGKALRAPATAEAHWIAGRAWTRLGRFDNATPLLERFVELAARAPEAPAAWHLLAQAAIQKGDTQRAAACAAKEDALGRWHAYFRVRRLQIRERPDEPLPRLGLAQLWLEVDELAAARAVLDDLVARCPEFARGWLALGETRRRQQDLAGARASYDRALELDPALSVARMNRAVIARLEGRDADARADLEFLTASRDGSDARFAAAHLELARLYARAGEGERSAAAFARYQALGGREKL